MNHMRLHEFLQKKYNELRLYCSIALQDLKKESHRSLLWIEMYPPPSSYVEDLTPKVTLFEGSQVKLNEVTRVGP